MKLCSSPSFFRVYPVGNTNRPTVYQYKFSAQNQRSPVVVANARLIITLRILQARWENPSKVWNEVRCWTHPWHSIITSWFNAEKKHHTSMTKMWRLEFISEMQGVLAVFLLNKMLRILLPNFVVKKVQTLPTKKHQTGRTSAKPPGSPPRLWANGSRDGVSRWFDVWTCLMWWYSRNDETYKRIVVDLVYQSLLLP